MRADVALLIYSNEVLDHLSRAPKEIQRIIPTQKRLTEAMWPVMLETAVQIRLKRFSHDSSAVNS